jgi:hypothetical protein
MKNLHPLKGWRKILATTIGTTLCTLFPPLAPIVAKLTGVYVAIQGAVDAAEAIGEGMKGQPPQER